MEIKSINNFSTAFSIVTKIAVGVCIASLLFAGFVFHQCTVEISKLNKELNDTRKSIVVLDPKSGIIQKGNFFIENRETREREYKHVVEVFLKNMYQFDQNTYEENINTGLNYSGEVGQSIAQDYENNQLYNKLVNENMEWYVTCPFDQIKIEERGEGYVKGVVYAAQTIVKPMGGGKRNLHATFIVRDSEGRSDKNLHGAIVDSWRIFNSENLKD